MLSYSIFILSAMNYQKCTPVFQIKYFIFLKNTIEVKPKNKRFISSSPLRSCSFLNAELK